MFKKVRISIFLFLLLWVVLSFFEMPIFAEEGIFEEGDPESERRLSWCVVKLQIEGWEEADFENEAIHFHGIYLWGQESDTGDLWAFEIISPDNMPSPWISVHGGTTPEVPESKRGRRQLDMPDGRYDVWITHGFNGEPTPSIPVRVSRDWGEAFNRRPKDLGDFFTGSCPNSRRQLGAPDVHIFEFEINESEPERNVTYILPRHEGNITELLAQGLIGESIPELDLGVTPPPMEFVTNWRGEKIVINPPGEGILDVDDSTPERASTSVDGSVDDDDDDDDDDDVGIVWHEDHIEKPEAYLRGTEIIDPEEPDLMNWILTNTLQAFSTGVWAAFGLHDPVTLFFSIDPKEIHGHPLFEVDEIDPEKLADDLYVDPANSFLYMFSQEEESLIKGVFGILGDYLLIPYSLAVVIIGAWVVIRSNNVEDRTKSKKIVLGILLFPLLVRFVPYMFEPLFWLNDSIVRALGAFLIAHPILGAEGEAVLARPFVTIMMSCANNVGSLGAAAVSVVLVVMSAMVNIQYFVRRVMLALLIMIFPVVAFMQIFPNTKEVMRVWWAEFGSNLFLQSVHAMVYVLFAHFVYVAKLPVLPILAMMASMSLMTTFIRNLMGTKDSSGIGSMMGGAIGMGSIMGAFKLFGGIAGGLGGDDNFTETPEDTIGPSFPDPGVGYDEMSDNLKPRNRFVEYFNRRLMTNEYSQEDVPQKSNVKYVGGLPVKPNLSSSFKSTSGIVGTAQTKIDGIVPENLPVNHEDGVDDIPIDSGSDGALNPQNLSQHPPIDGSIPRKQSAPASLEADGANNNDYEPYFSGETEDKSANDRDMKNNSTGGQGNHPIFIENPSTGHNSPGVVNTNNNNPNMSVANRNAVKMGGIAGLFSSRNKGQHSGQHFEGKENDLEDKNFGYATEEEPTGPVWGSRPRVKPKYPSQMLLGLASNVAMGAGTLTGSYLGGAAMGPAGIGVGAMAGAKMAGMGVQATNTMVGTISETMARNRIVEDVIRKNPEQYNLTGDIENDKEVRKQATVYAATGVHATNQEIAHDDTMRRQYINFTDTTGYKHMHEDLKLQKEYAFLKMMRGTFDAETAHHMSHSVAIRNEAAKIREQFMRQNPGATDAQASEYVLNNVIKPRMEAKSKDNMLKEAMKNTGKGVAGLESMKTTGKGVAGLESMKNAEKGADGLAGAKRLKKITKQNVDIPSDSISTEEKLNNKTFDDNPKSNSSNDSHITFRPPKK